MPSDRIVLAVFSSLVLLLILFGSLHAPHRFRLRWRLFIAMLATTIVMLLSHVAAGVLPHGLVLDGVCKSVAYVMFYATLSLSTYYMTAHVAEKTGISYVFAKLSIPICAVFAVGWCVSAFDGVLFSLPRGGWTDESLYWVGQAGGYAVFALILVIIFKNCRVLRSKDTLILLSFIVFPVFALFLRYRFGFVSIDTAIAVSELLIYIFVNMKHTERMYEQQLLIQKYKVSFLYNQIRPHFIFNVLNSIYILCAKDAAIAQGAIEKFSDYLRMNLALMEDDTAVPIERELELVRNYLALEELRFADELSVSYDIAATGFSIPPFTLQPIVENAVKHGIMPKKGGGTVAIRTFRDGEFHVVTVTDDGVGFPPGDGATAEAERHVGISNVRHRLNIICGGSVEIAAPEGGGTSVAVRIPAGWTGGGGPCG